MRKIRETRGFTLVEMIMVISIIGILGVVTFSFIEDTAGIYQLATAEEKIYDELWVAMERITRELEYANTAAPTVTPAGDTLTFTDVNKTACVNCADKSTAVVYTLIDPVTGALSTNLYRTGNLSGAHIIAANITNNVAVDPPFIITAIGTNSLVQIKLTKTEGNYSVTMFTKVLVNIAQNANLVQVVN